MLKTAILENTWAYEFRYRQERAGIRIRGEVVNTLLIGIGTERQE